MLDTLDNSTVAREACPKCGSKDNVAVYADGGRHCYSPDCSYHVSGSSSSGESFAEPVAPKVTVKLSKGRIKSIPDRRLSLDTCEKYNVSILEDPDQHLYPYYDDKGVHVANKIRSVKNKTFHSEGDIKRSMLFGQQQFRSGGKYITITEGEIDAMSVFEMLGSKWPVVSIKNGSASSKRDVANKSIYDFLMSFDNIIICFDADAAGKAGATKLSEALAPKAKIVPMHYKDANEYLKLGKKKDFVTDWWEAKQYTPEGIISGADLWEEVNEKALSPVAQYPYAGLDKLTHGIRLGELVTITAGSGLGKSQFVRELVYHALTTTNHDIGMMFLEESVKRSALGVMSLAANKPLHLPDVFNYTSEESRKEAFDQTLGTGRLYFYDHFGSTSIESILGCVRYFANVLSCKFIILDHVSIVLSDQQSGDERKAIDEIMTKLRMVVQELDISLILVSHLKRPSGQGHEEGAATSLSQLRGSASIGQLSDIVLSLERDGQADDPTERHTTTVRVLKNRFSGLTGPACRLLYNLETGRMVEREEDFEELQ